MSLQLMFLDGYACSEPLYERLGRLALKKYGTLHEFACHPCAGAMLIFSVSFQNFFPKNFLEIFN